jgi:hypothetical protein
METTDRQALKGHEVTLKFFAYACFLEIPWYLRRSLKMVNRSNHISSSSRVVDTTAGTFIITTTTTIR